MARTRLVGALADPARAHDAGMGRARGEPFDFRANGTGKSHFCEALGHRAIDEGLKVLWFTLETLTQTINRSKVDASTARVVARICRGDLIIVDDIGMLPAGQSEAEALYRIAD